MKKRIGRWGNSLAVRIPKTYAKELDLQEGVEIEVTRVNGGLLLRPCKHLYTLAELVEQIQPENIHRETDWGSAVGQEPW